MQTEAAVARRAAIAEVGPFEDADDARHREELGGKADVEREVGQLALLQRERRGGRGAPRRAALGVVREDRLQWLGLGLGFG